MAKTKKQRLEKDVLVGDYRIVEKRQSRLSAQCIMCGKQRNFTEKQLLKNPAPKCYSPDCLKPEDADKGRTGRRLSEQARKKLDNAYSTFEANSEEARRLLDVFQESAGAGVDLASLRTLLDLIPYAERSYRQYPSQARAYALNSLLEHARDIVRELQAAEGQESLLRSLVVDSMHPCTRDIAQAAVDMANEAWLSLEGHIDAKDKSKARDKLNASIVEYGRKVRELLEATRDRLLENVADPSAAPDIKQKRKPKGKRR